MSDDNRKKRFNKAHEKLMQAQAEMRKAEDENEERVSEAAIKVSEAMLKLEMEFPNEAERSPSVVDTLELLGEAFDVLHK